jgi:RND family efflux transporter MFP subunit
MEGQSQEAVVEQKPVADAPVLPLAAGHNHVPHKHVPSQSHVPVKAVPGTGRQVGAAAVGFAVALAAVYAFGLWSRHHAESSLAREAEESVGTPQAVEVATVTRADPRTELSLPGEARPLNETTLYARTSGYIDKWLVDIGDQVKEGQTLAIIDTPELDDQLNAAKAKLAQARSEANLAQSAADFAKVTYDRWQSAAPDGVVSEQERDEKKAQLDNSLAKVEAAKSAVAVADAEVHRLQTLINFKQVVAPFDGTITQRHIDIGDLVTAGSTTSTTPLFSIARFDQMRVFVNVPQGAIPGIKPGMKAVARAQEYPDRTFAGTVDRTSEAVDRSSRTMRVEVIVPNRKQVLKPGSYVEVSFETDRANPPIEIPAGALTFRPGGPEVAVVGANNEVTFRRVEIARDDGDHIEIASGLEDGDRVALNIGSDVTDGTVIHPHVESNGPVRPAQASAGSGAADAKTSEARR